MYKLLLISDQDDVLNAFASINNWELHGFKAPHIRHDYEGTLDSLAKHHADGICIAGSSTDEEEKILAYLQENFPDVSIFEAGHTQDEVLFYLSELRTLLNRIHADYSNDRCSTKDMLQNFRHEVFRKVIDGKVKTPEELHRTMRLMRSRMDADRPCLLIQVAQSAEYDKLEGRWHEGADRLEAALRNSFAADLNGVHILPTLHSDGRILVLACPLHGVDVNMTVDDRTATLTRHAAESIAHMKDFFGVDLHITEIRVLPALTSLCGETDQ